MGGIQTAGAKGSDRRRGGGGDFGVGGTQQGAAPLFMARVYWRVRIKKAPRNEKCCRLRPKTVNTTTSSH